MYQGDATVSVEVDKSGKVISMTTTSEKTPGDPVPLKQLAEVGMALGVTLQPQPYHSIRIDVSLKIPCEIAEHNEVFAYVKEWVDQKVNEVAQEANGGSGG